MAVAYANIGVTNNNGSAASTTVNFVAPATFGIVAGDIWVLSAAFRGGTTVTISGVPASLTLVKRTDSGSATSSVSIVSYTYVSLGTEIGGATIASITLSASSKYVASTDAVTGCSTSSPVSGVAVSGTGTTTAVTSSALAAMSAGQMAFCFGALQGSLSSPGVTCVGSTSPAVSSNTTGGSTATNVGETVGVCTAASNSSSQTWSLSSGSTTSALHAFILAPPAATAPTPHILFARQAVARASNW